MDLSHQPRIRGHTPIESGTGTVAHPLLKPPATSDEHEQQSAHRRSGGGGARAEAAPRYEIAARSRHAGVSYRFARRPA